MSECLAEETGGNAGIEQQGVPKKKKGFVVGFRDSVEFLDKSWRNSMKDLMGGEKVVPLCCATPWFLSFAVHGLLVRSCLETASELPSTIGLNCVDFVSVHLEILDGLLHREGRIVLVLEEEDQ